MKIVDRMIEEGYTPFDLKNEIGNRPESKSDVEHLARGKKVTYIYPRSTTIRSMAPRAILR